MSKKYGCDMRGMLSFQILWLLSKRQMHGEAIAIEIEKRRGEKPKAGTLYPALKELKSSGLVSSRESGKLIVYSLTQEGRNSLKSAINYFCRAFGEVFEEEKAAGR